MARVKKVGWKQLLVSAIGYALVNAVGIAIMLGNIDSGFAIVGAALTLGGSVAALVHIVAAGIRLADSDRTLSATDTTRQGE